MKDSVYCDHMILSTVYIFTFVLMHVRIISLTGFHQPETSSTGCEPCDAGHYQKRTGQPMCNPCRPGRYQVNEAQSTCTLCDRNYYQEDYGETACEPCDENEITRRPGSVSEMQCFGKN